MANSSVNKKAVWKNIFRLILPKRKQFLFVVLVSLLSTGVSLIEPLIYREAINDIAGIFVKQAKDDTRKELGVDENGDPIVAPQGPINAIDSLQVASDSTSLGSAPSVDGSVKKRVKHPHSQHKVSGRTPLEA